MVSQSLKGQVQVVKGYHSVLPPWATARETRFQEDWGSALVKISVSLTLRLVSVMTISALPVLAMEGGPHRSTLHSLSLCNTTYELQFTDE